MKKSSKITAFVVTFIPANFSWSQTSVFDCPIPVQNSQITDPSLIKEGGCFDFSDPSNYNYPSGKNKEFKACKSIQVKDDFKMGSSSSSGGKFKLSMANADIVLYEPTDLNSIPRYEKMELGIDLPDEIQSRVDAFIAGQDYPIGLNPFLEWQLKIKAKFMHVGPDFLEKSVDAFYYKDFERVIIPPDPYPFFNNDDPAYQNWGGHWNALSTNHPFRIRFAPPETGTWTCIIEVYLDNNVSPIYSYIPFNFSVVPSDNPGFVKVGVNKRYFTKGDETFIPLGPNFGWPDTYNSLDPESYYKLTYHGNTEGHKHFTAPIQSFYNYDRHLADLSSLGANNFRLIMVPWSLDIEFEKLGNYYDRQNIAWEMDNIVNIAKQNDLNIQWNLMIQYTLSGNPYRIKYWDWYSGDEYTSLGLDFTETGNDYDPYYPNSSLLTYDKGYCYHLNEEFNLTEPYEIFTNELAKKYYKQRLRYIISRWGYSTNIGMWELLSEINNVGEVTKKDDLGHNIICKVAPYKSPDPTIKFNAESIVEDWHEEMAGFIKNTLGDPHLISASYGGEIGQMDNTHELNTIDVVSENIYNSNWSPKMTHSLSNTGSIIDRMSSYGAGKPVSFSETGTLGALKCAAGPDEAFEDKRLIWMLPFSGVAVSNNWGFWNYQTHWEEYGKVKSFIGNIDLDGEHWTPGQYATSYSENPSAWNNMIREDKNAVIAYLQSGDKFYAMGVINNCTYNIYSKFPEPKPSCVNQTNLPPVIYTGIYNTDNSDNKELVDYRNAMTVSADVNLSDGFQNELLVRGMSSTTNYTVDYYDINSPETIIATQIIAAGSPNIILHYPDLNSAHPILAFKIYPTSLGWKKTNFANEYIPKKNATLTIFPNPTNGLTTIAIDNYDASNSNYKIVLYNSIGKLVQAINITGNKTDVDLSNYENGIYLLSFTDGEKTSVVRISKTN